MCKCNNKLRRGIQYIHVQWHYIQHICRNCFQFNRTPRGMINRYQQHSFLADDWRSHSFRLAIDMSSRAFGKHNSVASCLDETDWTAAEDESTVNNNTPLSGFNTPISLYRSEDCCWAIIKRYTWMCLDEWNLYIASK